MAMTGREVLLALKVLPALRVLLALRVLRVPLVPLDQH